MKSQTLKIFMVAALLATSWLFGVALEHCEAAAKSLRDAAKNLRELAAAHEQMAQDTAKRNWPV